LSVDKVFLCGLTNVNFLYRIGLLYDRRSVILGWILLNLLREFVMGKGQITKEESLAILNSSTDWWGIYGAALMVKNHFHQNTAAVECTNECQKWVMRRRLWLLCTI
jgi:hypothetical protein